MSDDVSNNRGAVQERFLRGLRTRGTAFTRPIEDLSLFPQESACSAFAVRDFLNFDVRNTDFNEIIGFISINQKSILGKGNYLRS